MIKIELLSAISLVIPRVTPSARGDKWLSEATLFINITGVRVEGGSFHSYTPSHFEMLQ